MAAVVLLSSGFPALRSVTLQFDYLNSHALHAAPAKDVQGREREEEKKKRCVMIGEKIKKEPMSKNPEEPAAVGNLWLASHIRLFR